MKKNTIIQYCLIGIIAALLGAAAIIASCGKVVKEPTATTSTTVSTTSTVTTTSTTLTTIIPTGVPDESFTDGTHVGRVVYGNASGGDNDDAGNSITIDSAGRILVAGEGYNISGSSDMVIWRCTSSGTLDASFNGDGIVVHGNAAGGDSDDIGNSITIDSAGRILVVGESRNMSGDLDMVIWRYNSNGNLDTSFGSNGIAVHHNAAGGGSADRGRAIAIDSSGRILVAGYSNNASGNADMVIWRYNSNGTLDTSFDSDGIVVHGNAAGGNGHDFGRSITMDSSGRILVAGYSYNASGEADMVIWRYNANGTLDASFDSDGIVVHHDAAGGGDADRGGAIAIDSSERILVAGSSDNASGNSDMVIWRYNSDGNLDASFDSDGIVVHHNAAGGNAGDFGSSITMDFTGRILVAGYSNNASGNADMVIWRYNSDGTLDTSFGSNGVVVHHNAAGGNAGDYGSSIATDSSGRILVAGYSDNASAYDKMVIWRYK